MNLKDMSDALTEAGVEECKYIHWTPHYNWKNGLETAEPMADGSGWWAVMDMPGCDYDGCTVMNPPEWMVEGLYLTHLKYWLRKQKFFLSLQEISAIEPNIIASIDKRDGDTWVGPFQAQAETELRALVPCVLEYFRREKRYEQA